MGFFDSIAASFRNAVEDDQFDRLCRELGWTIDERDDDGDIRLHFKGDSVRPRRDVSIVKSSDGEMLSFLAVCHRLFDEDDLPDDLMPALLVRNRELTCGAWSASIDDDGEVGLVVRYVTLAAGMDAAMFRFICCSLVEEVAFVENGLRKRGLM